MIIIRATPTDFQLLNLTIGLSILVRLIMAPMLQAIRLKTVHGQALRNAIEVRILVPV